MTQTKKHISPFSEWMTMFRVFMVTIVMVWAASSCTHENVVDPIDPEDPGNPIDTTGNPIDTMDPGTPCDPNIVYFNTQILPLLKSNCAKSGCHDAITHEEGIILDSYQNVMNSDVIEPYDLDDSDLYEQITEDDPDKIMPPPPNQRLTGEQIGLIAQWIQQGAKNEMCDESSGGCNTDNITYSGFIAPLLNTNCVGCHSGGAPSGGVLLNTHAGVRTVALNGRLFGAVSHASGFEPMPFGSPRLPQCTIDKIKSWIDDGAPAN